MNGAYYLKGEYHMSGSVRCAALIAVSGFLLASTPALAAKKKAPELVTCEESLGTIAVVDGDASGWTEWGLGSPRNLINALAAESGCFTAHNSAGDVPARFLVTAIAGSQEDVDQGMQLAKGAASEALLRSGAMSSVLTKVPMGGALLGAFGGFGGKKKTVAAGLRVVSPANGQTVAAGSGSVKKSTLSFKGNSGWVQGAAASSGYQGSKDGKMLTEAFVLAFNQLIDQRAAMTTAPQAGVVPSAAAKVAVDTNMRAAPAADAAIVRSLRAGTELTPSGEREGLFIEVSDSYGTTGWVSVENME